MPCKITVDPISGIMRIDGIIVCRILFAGDSIVLQFKDQDRQRSRLRGTEFVEINLKDFMADIVRLAS